MAISYVVLVLDLYDGQGDPLSAGTAVLAPSETLTDATGHAVFTQAPVTVSLAFNPVPSVQLVATDNTDLAQPEWLWLLTVNGAYPPRRFALPYSGGALQYLSDLTFS